MKRHQVYPDYYLKCEHLKGKPATLTITAAPLDTLKNSKGEEKKIVLSFAETKKTLPLNKTNFNAVADVCGDETDDWPGKKIEVYPTTTQMDGKTVGCIRVRSPAQRELPTPPTPKPGDDELDDDIPF
jgi:hypothetical protein